MKRTIVIVLVGLAALVGGFFLLDSKSEKLPDTSMYYMGSYTYLCDDGSEFTLSLPSDMKSIYIVPSPDVDRFKSSIVTKQESAQGVLYVGNGIEFKAKGETVTLTAGELISVCLPVLKEDEAPFNFGD